MARRVLRKPLWRHAVDHAAPLWQERSDATALAITVTKSDLIKRLADANPHLRVVDVERIVATVFEHIADALERGDRVELRGFGAFSVRQRGARIGRNPRTGDEVAVPSKVVPHFKTGKDLRERLNALG